MASVVPVVYLEINGILAPRYDNANLALEWVTFPLQS